MTLSPIPRSSVADSAFGQISAQVLDGRLAPGNDLPGEGARVLDYRTEAGPELLPALLVRDGGPDPKVIHGVAEVREVLGARRGGRGGRRGNRPRREATPRPRLLEHAGRRRSARSPRNSGGIRRRG